MRHGISLTCMMSRRASAWQTSFCMAYPWNSRETYSIMDASHSFDNDVPVVTRRWTDAAPEFAKAARTIRAQRPFVHYKSAPYSQQVNGRAEHFKRFLIEGTRCSLLQSRLGERWWPLAIVLYCVELQCSLYRVKDGRTQWIRRFNQPYEFQPYPFGALVFYVNPSDSHHPGSESNCGHSTKRWRSLLFPVVFVSITVGPGCKWGHSYNVVPLAFLLAEGRASRFSIRTVVDIVFLEVVSFPSQQRPMLHGAYEDTTLPAPYDH